MIKAKEGRGPAQARQPVRAMCRGMAAGFLLSALLTSGAVAANFNISPTSLELNAGAKSGVFSVINNGAEKLNCQVDVKEWAQDKNGKDVYSDTKDVVFFPKIMTVQPNEQRAIRIGMKGPLGAKEKTYRLFVEEIPSQKKGPDAKASGKITAGLTIAFRYAIPIFVKPSRPQESGGIEPMSMSQGLVGAVVRNTGNVHFRLLRVRFVGKAVDGQELFSQEVSGWYVLQGVGSRYETDVPKDVCAKLATIEVTAQAETVSFNGSLNVQRTMCAQ